VPWDGEWRLGVWIEAQGLGKVKNRVKFPGREARTEQGVAFKVRAQT